jgi:sporulation protein YlmC with PRC-barrel domain
MTEAIEDVSGLTGENVSDHEGRRIGKVKDIYGKGGEGDAPMWVTIEVKGGAQGKRLVFVPLARLKHEKGEVRVPYSVQHINSAPEIEPEEELSEDDERALRDYYAIDLGDQEMRTANESYANRVPDAEGESSKISADEASAEKMVEEARSGEKEAREQLEKDAEDMGRRKEEREQEEDSEDPDPKASGEEDSDDELSAASHEDEDEDSDEDEDEE